MDCIPVCMKYVNVQSMQSMDCNPSIHAIHFELNSYITTLTLTTSILRMMFVTSKRQLTLLLIVLVKCFNRKLIIRNILLHFILEKVLLFRWAIILWYHAKYQNVFFFRTQFSHLLSCRNWKNKPKNQVKLLM